MRTAAGPILVIVAVVLLLWGCSAAFSGQNEEPGDVGIPENCPYVGPAGC